MPVYSFETITEQQALIIGPTDNVRVATDVAMRSTVLFLPDGTISLTVGVRTVVFGSNFAALARDNGVIFPDGSRLFVGSSSPDRFDQSTSSIGGAAYGGDGADFLKTGLANWLVQGNQGDDQIEVSSTFSNTIYGGQGNDSILIADPYGNGTGMPSNFAQGNKGNDSIRGLNGPDTLLGGQGNDALTGGYGLDILNGNLGDDDVSGTGLLLGEDGNDSLTAWVGTTPDTNTIHGGGGNDRIETLGVGAPGHTGSVNFVSGDDGNDEIYLRSALGEEAFAGEGNDTISSANNRIDISDTLDGGAGNDSISTTQGRNLIRGGDGNDVLNSGGGGTLDGGEGDDRLLASFTPHVFLGGDGNDTMIDVAGSNYFDGGAGNDSITASGGFLKTINSGDGDDTVGGSNAAATINGGAGNDLVGDGKYVSGEAGDDTLSAGGENSMLLGGDGDDVLTGKAGQDTLDGGLGRDAMTGGLGLDVFQFSSTPGLSIAAADRIMDWTTDDRLMIQRRGELSYREETGADAAGVAAAQGTIAAGAADIVVVQVGADAVVFADYGSDNQASVQAVLVGRTLVDISSANFS